MPIDDTLDFINSMRMGDFYVYLTFIGIISVWSLYGLVCTLMVCIRQYQKHRLVVLMQACWLGLAWRRYRLYDWPYCWPCSCYNSRIYSYHAAVHQLQTCLDELMSPKRPFKAVLVVSGLWRYEWNEANLCQLRKSMGNICNRKNSVLCALQHPVSKCFFQISSLIDTHVYL